MENNHSFKKDEKLFNKIGISFFFVLLCLACISFFNSKENVIIPGISIFIGLALLLEIGFFTAARIVAKKKVHIGGIVITAIITVLNVIWGIIQLYLYSG